MVAYYVHILSSDTSTGGRETLCGVSGSSHVVTYPTKIEGKNLSWPNNPSEIPNCPVCCLKAYDDPSQVYQSKDTDE